MVATEFKMIAKTLHGLEDVLAQEIQALGGNNIEIGRRAVSFTGDKSLLYKANLSLRTALSILKPIHTFKAENTDELYDELSKIEWSEYMTPNQTFAIDSVVYSEVFKNSQFITYRTKDAIVDYFKEKTQERPTVVLKNPDIYINIHIAHNVVTLSLDSSGESLYKRGYRTIQTKAPINEVLAAGILLKAGWCGQSDLLDPMCGSGTFLIEAALIARNIAPGIYRQRFAFQAWQDYDEELFMHHFEDDSQERAFNFKIYGSDMLFDAVKITQKSIELAGLSKDIVLEQGRFENRPKPEQPLMIVMNPPYDKRLELQEPEEVYHMIGERLKHNYPGCKAWIIAHKTEHFDAIGLRPNSRTSLMNGSLECELRSYELFDGKRDDYKREKGKSFNERSKDFKPREKREDKFERPRRDNKPRRDRDSRPTRGGKSTDKKAFTRKPSNKEERIEHSRSGFELRKQRGSDGRRMDRAFGEKKGGFRKREGRDDKGGFRPKENSRSFNRGDRPQNERRPSANSKTSGNGRTLFMPMDRFRQQDGSLRPKNTRKDYDKDKSED